MNSFLLECCDSVVIDREVNKIIKDNGFTSSSISVYDLEESLLESALEDLDTYNFLSDNKTIIIKNIESIKYDDFKDDFEHLFKYLDNPQDDKLLIIVAGKLNNTLKTTKTLKKKCKYISCEINTKSFIKKELDGYDIKQDVINLIDDYCLGDISKISNECSKLKNYKYDEKIITVDDVKSLVIKKLGDPQELTFSFVRSLASRDRKKSIEKYRQLLEYNLEPLSIIGLIGSQFRIIYQVKLLDEKGMSNKNIASTLGEKEYRIMKTRELIPLYTEDDILKMMQDLADIDMKIKTTDTDANTEIELFILNI